MNRLMIAVVLMGSGIAATSPVTGQGMGQTDRQAGYGYMPYQSYPIQVRPSNYAAGYTYTLPPVYPSYRYHSWYGYPRAYAYPRTYVYPRTYRGPVVRSYPTTPSRSTSPFGPAHSSQYFGNPHASQYFGR